MDIWIYGYIWIYMANVYRHLYLPEADQDSESEQDQE